MVLGLGLEPRRVGRPGFNRVRGYDWVAVLTFGWLGYDSPMTASEGLGINHRQTNVLSQTISIPISPFQQNNQVLVTSSIKIEKGFSWLMLDN